ncbi:MAG: hypothetical protein WC080_03145 [Patescibacteria group bacterium]|jgi:hypothetical protein
MVKIKKTKKTALIFAATTLISVLPGFASAFTTGVAINGKTTFSSYMDWMKSIFGFAMKLGAVLTTLMILYAAIKYITSQGNSSATNEAKDIIIGSLSGFAMLLLIYLILNVLGLKSFAF